MSNPIGRPRLTGPVFPNCGHERTGDNILPNGRGCRHCHNARGKSRYAKVAKPPAKHVQFSQEHGQLTGRELLQAIRQAPHPVPTMEHGGGRSYALAPRRELVPERKTG